jgi:8-oxo-dGTP pyrophosphatase MutT (NUDIX family)
VDALRREVFEETGLTVTGASLFGTFSDPSRIIHYAGRPPRRVISFVYRATVESVENLRTSAESLELRFIPRAELATLDIVETARPIIDAYLTQEAVVLA